MSCWINPGCVLCDPKETALFSKMEMSNILIYAIVGAICLAIMTGGFLSMSDAEPSSGQIGTGAIAGAGLGAAAAYYLGDAAPGVASVLSSMSGGGDSSYGSAFPEMKVGLPGF